MGWRRRILWEWILIMGLLDIGSYVTDPSNAANLGLISGLLQGGGYSRMPVSTGQAIGMGLQGANTMQAQNTSQQLGLEQLQAARFSNQMNQNYMKMMAQQFPQLFGQQSSPSNPSNAPDQGSAPSLLNPQDQPSTGLVQGNNQPQAQQGNPGFDLGSPILNQQYALARVGSMFGKPGATEAMTAALSNSPYYKDPDSLRLMSMGIYPGTPQWGQALAQVQNKAGYIPPVMVRQGSMALYPDKTSIFNPSIPEGTVPLYDGQGNVVATRRIDGTIQGIQQNAQAQAAGKATQIPITQYDANGNAITKPLSNVLNPGMGTGTYNGGDGGYKFAVPQPGIDTISKQAATQYSNDLASASNIPNTMQGLSRALNVLQETGINTGPGAKQKFNLIGMLNTSGIPLEKGDATGYQTISKYLNNALGQAAAQTGFNGSDARLEAFTKGNPDAEHMNPIALKEAIQFVQGQQLGALAKTTAQTNFLQTHSPSQLPQFNAQWTNLYNNGGANAMSLKALSDAKDQAAFINSLSVPQRKAMLNAYDTMQQWKAF